MDFHEVFTVAISRLRPYVLVLLFASIGLILIGYGLITYFLGDQNKNEVTFSHESPTVAPTSPEEEIVVDIEGSVKKPGVYRMQKDSRVSDIVEKAGGFSGVADNAWIAKNLNLARKLTDGGKLYVPTVGEQTSALSSQSTLGFQTFDSNTLTAESGLININTATSAQLDSLPGIGPVTAEKIINARPFASVQELLDKKVVSTSVFGKIKDKITAE